MAHHTQQVLTILAVVILFGLSLTGCTATWSGSIDLDVLAQAHTHPTPPAETQ